MSLSSSSSSAQYLPLDPRLYCETINELHSYITSSKRGYLTQAELFRYYRQRHDNAEIPYRLLGYRSLLDLLSSDQRLFAIDLRREPAYVYSAVKVKQMNERTLTSDFLRFFSFDKRNANGDVSSKRIRRLRKIRQRLVSEGTTSFSRQHHSTNTLDDQNSNTSVEFAFFVR